MKKTFFMAVLIILAVNIGATEYYVDYVSGNDNNNGRSTANSWKHFPGDPNASGISNSTLLLGGDVVYFHRGSTYDGTITTVGQGLIKDGGEGGRIDTDGRTLNSAMGRFLTNGVTIADKVYINGEGLFGISSVDSESQLTLSSQVTHTPGLDVEFLVGAFITITTTNWGSGPAVLRGMINLTGSSCILIDGAVPKGIEITQTNSYCVYVNNGSAKDGYMLRNLYMHHSNGDDNAAVYLRNCNYVLVDNCEIAYNGDGDGTTGDDGITATTHCDYLTIQYCDIHNNGDDGIQLAPANRSYVQYNRLHHTAPDAGDVHPDAIATNATSNFDCIIRYNMIFDNRNPTDLEHINMQMYCNIIYDTSIGPPGNHGIRVKLGVTGKIYNNIVAWNNAAIQAYSTSGQLDIQNNIFWENADQSDGYEVSLNSGDICRNNIYSRRLLNPRDKIISYAGVGYKLQEFRDAHLGPSSDNGSGSLAATPSKSDWTSEVFVSDERSAPDFRISSQISPQVDSGVNLDGYFSQDIIGILRPQGLGWDIGVYESPYSSTAGPSSPSGLRLKL